MSDWVATTRSGTTYTSKDGCVMRDSHGSVTHYHNPEVRRFHKADVLGDQIFEKLREIEPSDEPPKPGEHIYVLTFGDGGWVISTEIQDVVVM